MGISKAKGGRWGLLVSERGGYYYELASEFLQVGGGPKIRVILD